jgi:hypothetical protein
MTTFEGSHLRPRLEHAQIITKEDVVRLKRMGGASSSFEWGRESGQLMELMLKCVQSLRVFSQRISVICGMLRIDWSVSLPLLVPVLAPTTINAYYFPSRDRNESNNSTHSSRF